MNNKKSGRGGKPGRALSYVLVTALVVCSCGYIVGFTVFRGPSEKLSAKAVTALADSRTLGFVPSVFLSAEDIARLEGAAVPAGDVQPDGTAESEPEPTPEPTPEPEPAGPQPDAYGFVDEDGDGVIFDKFNYKGSTVYLLITLDPSRVFAATAVQDPTQPYGNGITLENMISTYDAVGGINAGGFIDVAGAGAGWPPYGITYSRGQCFNPDSGGPVGAFNSDDVFFTGYYSGSDCDLMGVRDAVSFGPVLVSNGVKSDEKVLESNIGPRTAIGQRADKAVVMMAVDGRQAYSIGLTYSDCADIMLEKCGCVNAVNMDGGNSTCMYFNGQMINNSSNAAGGTRNLPTAWLIGK